MRLCGLEKFSDGDKPCPTMPIARRTGTGRNSSAVRGLRRRPPAVLAAALWLFLAFAALPSFAATGDIEARYSQARHDYGAALALTDKAAKAEALKKVIGSLRDITAANSTGSATDRCLYLTAQTYHHLYDLTQSPEARQAALDHYRTVSLKHRRSPLADDAQYLIGVLFLDTDISQAYVEFSKVGIFFPKGDMKPRAAQRMVELSQRMGCAPKRADGKSSSSPPAPPQKNNERADTAPVSPTAPAAAKCPSPPARLKQIKHWSNRDYTRVALYTSDAVSFEEHIHAADPAHGLPVRITVHLKDCVIPPQVKSRLRIMDSFLKEVRTEQVDASQARIVLDTEAVDSYRIFAMTDPNRIIIDVRAKSCADQTASPPAGLDARSTGTGTGKGDKKTESISSTASPSVPQPHGESPPGKPSSPASQENGRSSAVPAPAAPLQQTTPAKPQGSRAVCPPGTPDLAQQLGLTVSRIVLDPGHGGKDKGASSPNGIHEKDLALVLARELKDVLEKRTGCEVILTRTRDQRLSLEERTAMANAQKADLFISLHTNAHEDHSLHGIETYFLNLSKDKEAARVAALENATSSKKMSDLEAILQDLLLNTKIAESSRLAATVQANIVNQLKVNYDNVRDLGTKQAPFFVLMGAEMPSILIEAGFITHPREEIRLKDKSYQRRLVEAIATGVEAYMQSMKGIARAGEKS